MPNEEFSEEERSAMIGELYEIHHREGHSDDFQQLLNVHDLTMTGDLVLLSE